MVHIGEDYLEGFEEIDIALWFDSFTGVKELHC